MGKKENKLEENIGYFLGIIGNMEDILDENEFSVISLGLSLVGIPSQTNRKRIFCLDYNSYSELALILLKIKDSVGFAPSKYKLFLSAMESRSTILEESNKEIIYQWDIEGKKIKYIYKEDDYFVNYPQFQSREINPINLEDTNNKELTLFSFMSA